MEHAVAEGMGRLPLGAECHCVVDSVMLPHCMQVVLNFDWNRGALNYGMVLGGQERYYRGMKKFHSSWSGENHRASIPQITSTMQIGNSPLKPQENIVCSGSEKVNGMPRDGVNYWQRVLNSQNARVSLKTQIVSISFI